MTSFVRLFSNRKEKDVSERKTTESISYGYHLTVGRRADMEDAVSIRVHKDTFGDEKVAFFVVFDGHGGAAVVQKIKQRLIENIIDSAPFKEGTDIQAAIEEGFRKTDEEVIQDAKASLYCGSTAAMLVAVGNQVYLAHIGDTRIVFSTGNGELHATSDHKANREDEKKRIEDLGGMVLYLGTWRVEGMLAVTRAFGDGVLKKMITADPEVVVKEVPPSMVSHAIIATDGVWDVLTNDEAMKIVLENSNPKQGAKCLVDAAFGKGSMDNISAIVVSFNH